MRRLTTILIDDAHAARRRYKKDLDYIKPDLAAYNKQKEAALGLAPGSLTKFDPTSGSSSVRISFIPPRIGHSFLTISCSLPRQVNSNSRLPRIYIETPTHSCMATTSRPRMRLTGLSVRLTRSAFCSLRLSLSVLTFHGVHSIDKKGKFSRKRLNEDKGDITYINEHNRVFNKKVRGAHRVHLSWTAYLIVCGCRLRGITTSTQQRFGRVSSGGRHCRLKTGGRGVVFILCTMI